MKRVGSSLLPDLGRGGPAETPCCCLQRARTTRNSWCDGHARAVSSSRGRKIVPCVGRRRPPLLAARRLAGVFGACSRPDPRAARAIERSLSQAGKDRKLFAGADVHRDARTLAGESWLSPGEGEAPARFPEAAGKYLQPRGPDRNPLLPLPLLRPAPTRCPASTSVRRRGRPRRMPRGNRSRC